MSHVPAKGPRTPEAIKITSYEKPIIITEESMTVHIELSTNAGPPIAITHTVFITGDPDNYMALELPVGTGLCLQVYALSEDGRRRVPAVITTNGDVTYETTEKMPEFPPSHVQMTEMVRKPLALAMG